MRSMKRIFYPVVLAICLSTVQVAANPIETTFRVADQTLHLYVETSGQNLPLSVRIAEMTVEEETLEKMTEQQYVQAKVYTNSFRSDESGIVDVEISFPCEKRFFTVKATDGVGEVYTSLFTSLDDDDKDEIFGLIKNAETAVDMGKKIAGYYPAFRLDYSNYLQLSDAGQEKVVQTLFETGLTSIQQFEQLFNETVVCLFMTENLNKQPFYQLVDRFRQQLLHPVALTYYETLTEAQKEKVTVSSICDFTDFAKMQESLSAAMLRDEINGVLWQYVYDILAKYDAFLEHQIPSGASGRTAAESIKSELDQNAQTLFFADVDAMLERATRQTPGGGGGVGMGGGKITIQDTYTAGGAVDVSHVTDASKVPVKQGFSDLDSVPWAVESIAFLKEKGIVSGRSETTFDPMSYVTREEFVKLLVHTLQLEPATEAVPFGDTEQQAWYYTALSTAYHKGLIQGVSASTFGIGSHMDRQDVATVIARALQTPETDEALPFADAASIDDYARAAVQKTVALGLLKGRENNQFAPKEKLTRAESAVVLHRLFSAIEENRQLLGGIGDA